MEFHVRKVREVETGGKPTGFLEPMLFELNSSMTAFSMNGKPLFDDLFTMQQGTQTEAVIPQGDLQNVF
jgi:hypothetical protein